MCLVLMLGLLSRGRLKRSCFRKYYKVILVWFLMEKNLEGLSFPLEGKYVAMIAPSFVANFSYPSLICRLKALGFDKVVELTFGAKMINREYHEILAGSNKLWISSACPGVVSTIENKMPQYKNNLVGVDSPMVAMAKICKKHFKEYKTVFISPCDFKKVEAEGSKYVDYVVDYDELESLFKKYKIGKSVSKETVMFDSFYNDYTKVFPLGGGLAKTAHLKNILKEDEFVCIDGIVELLKFLENPTKGVRFVDCLFCVGGCIGGPHTNKVLSVEAKKKRVLKYLVEAKREDIPEDRKGLVEKATGISFRK